MSGLKAEDAFLNVKNTDGNNSWTELADAYDVSVSVSPNLLDDTTFSNDAPAQIKGLIDGSIDISIRATGSPSSIVQDIRDAATDANATNESLDVEFAPNGQSAGGQGGSSTTVVAFTAMPSDLTMSASSGSEQDESYTLEVSDGNKPTVSQASLSS